MAHLPERRPDTVDRSPKVTLEEAADRFRVDVDQLRRLVAVHKIKPAIVAYNPHRRYYSLLRVKQMLLLVRRGTVH